MNARFRASLVAATLTALSGTALAQVPPPTGPSEPGGDPAAEPAMPTMPTMPGDSAAAPEQPPPEDDAKKKEPKRGDFDFGGQTRFPNGPDEMGEFATFNWVAVDLEGRYFVFDGVTINGNFPLAVIKPDDLGPLDPRMVGGGSVTLDIKTPTKGPFIPKQAEGTEAGLILTGAYMRENAMLLSEKDFPLFVGDFKPGFAGGLRMKAKLSSVIDFALTPQWVFQSGSAESAQAVQIPMSTIVALGDMLKVSVDLGVYTGDDYTFRSSKGGRVTAGGAIDVKIGPILAHAGAGVASLGTGDASMYPTIADSVYVDLNVKYAK
jgi:hypothetical protein